VLVVNGFHRLASPAYIDNDSMQGFLLERDMGVSYGRTAGWTGRQLNFRKDKMGIEDSTGLGYGLTDMAGQFIAGNDFNYIRTHAEAIRQAGYYNIMSCSADALTSVSGECDAVDLILGLECNDGYSLIPYKTFTPSMQSWLKAYVSRGGCLLTSGAYVGSDMSNVEEQAFLADVLKCRYLGKDASADETVNGMGTTLSFYRHLNERHYAAPKTDILQPVGEAIVPLAYADGYGAAVAYSGSDYRTFTLGFPFECIKSEAQQAAIMKGILTYLINN
jgi:hypothetical protein